MSSFSSGYSRKRNHDEYSNSSTPENEYSLTGRTPTSAPKLLLSSLARPRPEALRALRQSRISTLRSLKTPLSRPVDKAEEEDGEEDREDAEEEEDDAEGEGVSEYNVINEKLPVHIAHDDRLRSIVDRSARLLSELQECLCPFFDHSEDISTMYNRAQAAQTVTEPKKPLIMLLGETGAGKSSTTNSFVDEVDATRAAANGDSCTSVPTLLVSSLPGQTKPYAAEIRFFESTTRREFLREQLRHYNRYQFANDPTWSDEDRREFAALSLTAETTFLSLFGNYPEFQSPGSIRLYLSDNFGKYTEEHTVNLLESVCFQLFSKYPYDGHTPFLRFESDSIKELNEQVDPHVFPKWNFGEVELWPLVDHVCKALRNSSPLQYVDLLDLPGTSDINRVRSGIAHKFVTKADGLWMVADIDRVITNPKLDMTFATYGERFGSNVAVIATKSDANVNDNTIRSLQSGDQSTSAWWNLVQSIQSSREALTRSQSKLNRASSGKRAKTMTGVEELRLRREIQSLETGLKRLRNEQLDAGVKIRNTSITRRLRAEKRHHLKPDAQLAVFCVSNTHYAAHKGPKNDHGRLMKVETTQIPALRRHALMMAAPARFVAFSATINEALIALEGVRLWTEATPAKRLAGLMTIVNQPAALLDVVSREYRQKCQRLLSEKLILPLMSGQTRSQATAQKVANEIHGWNASVTLSFFNHYGKWQTPTKPYEVWNERFTEEQTLIVNAGWEEVVTQQAQTMESGIEKIKNCVKELPDELSRNANALPIPLEPLKAMVAGYAARIERIHNDRVAELEQKLSNIKLDVTRDVPTAYFSKSMVPMYDEAMKDHGPGVRDRRMDLLKKFLKGRSTATQSPFVDVFQNLQASLTDAFNWTARTLESDIKDILDDMSQQFGAVLQRHNQSAIESQARSRLLRFFVLKNWDIQIIKAEFVKLKSEYGMELTPEEEQYRTGT